MDHVVYLYFQNPEIVEGGGGFSEPPLVYILGKGSLETIGNLQKSVETLNQSHFIDSNLKPALPGQKLAIF